MNFFGRAGVIARNFTFTVERPYAEGGSKREFVKQLESRNVNLIFDVGANSGQYATDLRMAAYRGRIVSFEPLPGPFFALEKNAAKDPLWDCRQYALGDVDGKVLINVAGNAGASSSVLPMLATHQEAFPAANYVGTHEATLYRLDSVASDFLRPGDVTFLKIDVQAFEKQVIAGGASTIDKSIVGLQIELSFVPLYENGMLFREALDLVYSLGFTLTGLVPGFTDPRNGRMLQADGVFFRE